MTACVVPVLTPVAPAPSDVATPLPHLVNGIALGLLFALLALGFMLIVGLMETINLAHGSFFALGAYIALMIVAPPLPAGLRGRRGSHCRSAWRYAIALLLAPAIVGVFGMVLELALRRTYGKDPLYGLLLTFGAAIVIEEADSRGLGVARARAAGARSVAGPVVLGDLLFARYRFYAAAAAALAIVALWLFIEKDVVRRDHQGRRLRQRDGARARYQSDAIAARCIRPRRALAALAGIVLAPIWGIRPQVGVDAVVPAFLIIVLGGVGSFWGAVAAGLLVGMVVGLTGAFAGDWAIVSMYLLFIAVVTLRARAGGQKKRARCLSRRAENSRERPPS